ncbi:hypothetical protein LR48_Vigan01g339900 [Vigna angularis]|uniref:Uncharacterized protein n=1 Tax=Phaseolus angularis TaxID=3914 RepID=A0A0L9TTC6_PHAAN|nr:hypothetical protein LR48_Vigan01g339900 [Vigna angularis]
MPNTRTLFLLGLILAPNNQRRRQSRGTHELHHGLLRSQPLLSPALSVLAADARRLAALTAALFFLPASGRCVICGGVGISDAYYCKECTQQEKDRDGCPKIVNLGSAKTDLFYERKKYGFKKR